MMLDRERKESERRWRRIRKIMKTEKNKLAYRRKAPATTGAFISSVTLKPPKMPSNTMRYFAHLPPDIGHFNASQQSQMHATAAKSRHAIPTPKIYLFHRCNHQIFRFLSPSRMPLRFISRQPISSGSTTSAGRQKKAWGKGVGERGGYGGGLVSKHCRQSQNRPPNPDDAALCIRVGKICETMP